MISYQVPISVKGIVFEKDAVWLRRNERQEWELPGGKIDEGEQPTETIIRELEEELGFKTSVIRPVHAFMYTIKKSVDESQGVLVLSYLCKLISKSGVFETKGEAGHAEFKKFSLDQIKTLNMPEFYKNAVNTAWKEK